MKTNQTFQRSVRPSRALVVDDDKFMQEVLGDMLRDIGVCEVTTASSGDGGVEALEQAAQPPDLILCDLNMPRGDGFQFMERLGELTFGGGIILVSGMNARTVNSAELMGRFHRLNILGSLPKPVTEADLRNLLGQAA